MSKFISIEQFINDLKSVPYGIHYIEFVTNIKNQLSKGEDGEKHHLYMKAICGENDYLYKLSYKNHIIAHILLAEAGLQGNFNWKHKSLCALTRFTNKQFEKLSDIEKIELDDIYHWADIRRAALTANGKHLVESNREYWKNISDEERKQRGKIVSESVSKVWENRTIEERKKVGNNISKALTGKKRTEDSINNQKNTWLNKTEEEKNMAREAWSEGLKKMYESKTTEEREQWRNNISKGHQNRTEEEKRETSKRKHEAYVNMSQETKTEKYRKTAEGVHNTYINKTKEQKQEFSKSISQAQLGSWYMTNDGITVHYVIPRKQQALLDKGWYRCHRSGTPLK